MLTKVFFPVTKSHNLIRLSVPVLRIYWASEVNFRQVIVPLWEVAGKFVFPAGTAEKQHQLFLCQIDC
jgi:hypothetical protein